MTNLGQSYPTLHIVSFSGYTGDSEKVSWIKTDLGFDWAFNYKTQDVRTTLKIAAPTGVDVFLDAVGGVFHSTVLEFMAPRGRICLLGNLAAYNHPKAVPMVPTHDLSITLKVEYTQSLVEYGRIAVNTRDFLF